MSALLLIASGGRTLALIPLYAIGVFTGFTLSQAGLVVHWSRSRTRHWRRRAALNGTGAVATGMATLVFLLTKFTEGAWVVALAIPGLIVLFTRVGAYYRRVAELLGLGMVPDPPRAGQTVVIVPVAGVSRLAQRAISEALSISREVIAVTVLADSSGPGSRRALLREQWVRWNPGVPLQMLHTEYASVARPVVAFIDDLRERQHKQVIVLIPVIIPDRLRYRLLHNHLDTILSTALRGRDDVIIARVPLLLRSARGRTTGARTP